MIGEEIKSEINSIDKQIIEYLDKINELQKKRNSLKTEYLKHLEYLMYQNSSESSL